MGALTYNNKTLYFDHIELNEIADTFSTPAYVYSRNCLENNYQAYSKALCKTNHLICYAVKANSNLSILKLLAQLGCGFDIVSYGELERVLRAGGSAEKVVFSGVGKQKEELQKALQAGIYCFNVESASELLDLQEVAQSMDCIAPVSLRVNPDIDAKTHPYISTGLKNNKFGIDIDEALTLYQQASEFSHIRIQGIDCHIGSQITELSPFADVAARLLRFIDDLGEVGLTIEHINFGGGLGVNYDEENVIPSVSDYIHTLIKPFEARSIKMIFEPGRSLIANAGVLLTRIIRLKHTKSHNFAVVDAAMNDLLRPSLYQAWHNIMPVTLRDEPHHCYDIVGPICETGDYLGKNRDLSVCPNDVLAISHCGAYGFAMSSQYNTRPRACEVLLDQGKSRLIRPRETLCQLLDDEAQLIER